MDRRKVLFLCTGNSARSQMAEAVVNARLGSAWIAFSAGTRPAPEVHPMAVTALAEIGIQHKGSPKPISEFRGESFDLVVTVCDRAAEECPLWLGQGAKIHIGFPDPAVAGDLVSFRQVRDSIADVLVSRLQAWKPGQPE